MSSSDGIQHLSAERIQAFLEGELPLRQRAAFEEHAHSCARCKAEVEAWGLVLAELSGLARLEPPPGFADRVMAARPAPRLRPARLRDRLVAALLPHRPGRVHPTPERLQDLADGLLRGRRLARARQHLATCRRCASAAESWEGLMRGLDGLSVLEPPAGFADRVMARVRVRQPSLVPRRTPTLTDRLAARARALVPTTRRGWAVVSGVAGAPAVAMAAMAYVLVSHPLLTPGYLFSFVWWRVSALLTGAAQAVLGGLVDSVAVFRVWSGVEALAASPATLVAAGVAFSLATLVASWVLYRNLLPAHSSTRRGYAHA